MTPELLTVEQFAELLNVSRTTVFAWLNSGILQEGVHYIRLGRILRFRWSLDTFFCNKTTTRAKQKVKKRPTAPGRSAQSSSAAVNLDYGALTV